jgi:hypothetical protein
MAEEPEHKCSLWELGQVDAKQIVGGICVHSSPDLTLDPKHSALDSEVYQCEISLDSSHLRLLH